MSNCSIITLDFEASSLAETGYPIEVAVVIGDSTGIQTQFGTLIAPRPEWKGHAHWSVASQAIHGIEFEWLSKAMPADSVCDMLNLLLADRSVFVDGGTYDHFWLERLYAGRIIPFRLNFLEGIDVRDFIELKKRALVDHRALSDAIWLFGALNRLKCSKVEMLKTA